MFENIRMVFETSLSFIIPINVYAISSGDSFLGDTIEHGTIYMEYIAKTIFTS